jgi:thermitase
MKAPAPRRGEGANRVSHGVRLLIGAACLSLIVAGCSARPGTAPSADTTSYLLTVDLTPRDTIESTLALYGGEVLLWEEGDVAILAFAERPELGGRGRLSRLSAKTTLEQNEKFSGVSRISMNGMSTLWAGGFSTVWAGGFSTVWAGGFSTLWAGGEYGWMPENTAIWQQIGLEGGQALARNLGFGVKVAIVDTGADLNHPAIRESLAPSGEWYDFYSDDPIPQEERGMGDAGYGHGTNVAGIVRQIAPRATILPLRVLGPDGSGDAADLVRAINWAVNKGADVINLSLGASQPIEAVETALRVAAAHGILVVSSSGDSGDRMVTYPASMASVSEGAAFQLSITSVDGDDEKSSFATHSRTKVELAAPGENLYGPYPELGLSPWSGTSMSAGVASGSLALALGESLAVPADRLGSTLMSTSDDIYANGANEQYQFELGAGRINLEKFLERVISYSGAPE